MHIENTLLNDLGDIYTYNDEEVYALCAIYVRTILEWLITNQP